MFADIAVNAGTVIGLLLIFGALGFILIELVRVAMTPEEGLHSFDRAFLDREDK